MSASTPRTPTPAQQLVLLGSLYLSQGLPFGFLTQAVPVLLRQEGASLTTIGDTSLLLMPWLLKVLWAPWVDRWYLPSIGRRRSWILPLQGSTVLLFAGLATLHSGQVVPLLLTAMAASALLSATQDVATDGLAVRLLSAEQRGLGNGVQVAGYRLGMVIGGGALLVVFARLGLSPSFGVMAALIALASIPILLWREPPEPPPEAGGGLALAFAALRRRGMGGWLGLLVAYKLGEQLGGAVTRPMLVDLSLSLDTIGWLSAADSGASLLGALAGGLIAGRAGRGRGLLALGLLQATGVLAWALPALTEASLWGIAAVKLYDGFVGSMATVALFTAMMDVSDPRQGGTDYTLQASVVLIAAFGGSILGGRLADALITATGSVADGYAAHFGIASILTVLGALAMLWRPALPLPSEERA